MSKKLYFLFSILYLFWSVSVANGATTLMAIGRSPFHQPPLVSSGDLLSMLQTKQVEVEKGFTLAGYPELYEPFMEQVTTTEINKVDFQKGATFEWMFYKKKGKGTVRVVKDVTWGNEKSFPGFRLDVDKDGKRYAFAVPLGCGNVALIGMSDIPVVTPPPVAVPPEPAPESKPETVPVAEIDPLSYIIDVGYSHQFDPAHYLFARFGLEYAFNENWSVLGLIGASPHIAGSDGKSAFIADVLAEYSFSRWYIDLGVGAWITNGDSDMDDEDSQVDLIAAVGARIFGEPDEFNTSLFFEVRSAPDELSDIKDYGRFGLGVRFRF